MFLFFFKRSKSNKTHPTLDDDPNWQIISICLKPQIARQFGEAKLPEAHWRRRAGPAPGGILQVADGDQITAVALQVEVGAGQRMVTFFGTHNKCIFCI